MEGLTDWGRPTLDKLPHVHGRSQRGSNKSEPPQLLQPCTGPQSVRVRLPLLLANLMLGVSWGRAEQELCGEGASAVKCSPLSYTPGKELLKDVSSVAKLTGHKHTQSQWARLSGWGKEWLQGSETKSPSGHSP